jgi:hypothetical protein
MKEEKILQIVNLSPSEEWVERIVEIHPMKQIFWASIVQACVFGFMLFSFWGISIGLEAEELDLRIPETDYDFRQIEEDAESINNIKYSTNFNIENPKHKYFLVMNVLDTASTIYAMENRDNIIETNFLLPAKPTPEELFLHKALVIYALSKTNFFSNHPDEQWSINFVNVGLTIAVLNNLDSINNYD